MVDFDVVRDLELELPCRIGYQRPCSQTNCPNTKNQNEGCSIPRGPLTVSFLLYVFRYDVMSFLTNKSPMVSSTPGGIESGVRPSLDGRCVVAEKVRRAVVVGAWNAGTRKLGNVTVDEGEAAVTALCRACRPARGASILWAATVGLDNNSRRAP